MYIYIYIYIYIYKHVQVYAHKQTLIYTYKHTFYTYTYKHETPPTLKSVNITIPSSKPRGVRATSSPAETRHFAEKKKLSKVSHY